MEEEGISRRLEASPRIRVPKNKKTPVEEGILPGSQRTKNDYWWEKGDRKLSRRRMQWDSLQCSIAESLNRNTSPWSHLQGLMAVETNTLSRKISRNMRHLESISSPNCNQPSSSGQSIFSNKPPHTHFPQISGRQRCVNLRYEQTSLNQPRWNCVIRNLS